MSQLNIYVPPKIEKQVRQKAKNRHMSLSAYVADLLQKETPQNNWPAGFFTKIFGRWQGRFPEIVREPPEDLETL